MFVCVPCILFERKSSFASTAGFCNWKKHEEKLYMHENLKLTKIVF